MASLRKKPTETVAEVEPAPPVAEAINSDEPMSPSPAPSPADNASQVLKRQLEALQETRTLQEQVQVAIAAAQERREAWLKSNQLAQQNYAALNALHNEAVQSGLVDTSPEYFDYLNNRLASLQTQHPAAPTHLVEEMRTMQHKPEPPQPKPVSVSNFVSAPVSRDIPSGDYRRNGQITLTPQDREFARIAGVTDAEYAKQKARMLEMKATGEFNDRR